MSPKGPIFLFTGVIVLAATTLIFVSLMPVVPFRESDASRLSSMAPSTFEQKTIADSLSALAVQQLTTHGRQRFARDLAARLANNPTPSEAAHYVQGRALVLQGLSGQLEADAALFEKELAQGVCGPGAELQFAATMWELASFREAHFHGLTNVITAGAVAETLANDHAATGRAIDQLQTNMLLRVGDSALKANCFDLAYEMYKKVVPVAQTVSDMLRAKEGIEAAQQKRSIHR